MMMHGAYLPVLTCPSHVQIRKMSSSVVLRFFYHQHILQRAVRTSLKKEGLLDGWGGGGGHTILF